MIIEKYAEKELFFDRVAFNQALEAVAAMAAQSEHDPEGLHQEVQMLAECGALSAVLPGGFLDFNAKKTPQLLQLLLEVGQANLSLGRLLEGHYNTLYLIHLYATPAQRNRWYDCVRNENQLFGVWNTQAGDGIQFLQTTKGWQLQGSKTFCSGATLVDQALITGQIADEDRNGWQMCIVEMEKIAPQQIDRSSWKPLGMVASGSFKVDFSGCRLTNDDLLGLPGWYLQQPHFSAGAIRFAAVHLGGAAAIAKQTIAFLQSLQRTEDTFQQLRLGSMMTKMTEGQLWLDRAGEYFDAWVDAGEADQELITFANMVRTAIEEISLHVMDQSNRCVGARGLMEPSSLGRLHRDLVFYLRQPAPDATRVSVGAFFMSNPFNFSKHGI